MAHGDYTGKQKSVLAQRYADEQQFAAKNTSLVTAVVTENRSTPVDLRNEEDFWNEQHSVVPDDSLEEGVQVVDKKDPEMQPVKFRCRETLDQVTVGKNREFNLEEGRIYIAPKWVVSHLDDKGLVYH